jgi:hypothetical protein
VALENLLDAAVQRGERIDEGGCIRHERKPMAFFKSRLALNAIAASETRG